MIRWIALAAAYLACIAVHEFGHALAVWACGGLVAEFALFAWPPHVTPAGSFTDPQGQALNVTAALSTGAALPSWLSFSPSTMAFSGTAPAKAQTLALKITATDTSGLSTYETFNAAITAASTHALTAGDWLSSSIAKPAVAETVPATAGGWSTHDHASGSLPQLWAAHHANLH